MHWWTWVLLCAFLRPLVDAFFWIVGEWWFHVEFDTEPRKFSQLIIQITTTGREQDRVNEIISEIRAYRLSMPHTIWVVNEPEMGDDYPDANRVITVPPDFSARSQYKARAIEYSRLERKNTGLSRSDVKILFLDDDTSPTREYVETAFAGNYDVCQGITAPRIHYGGPSLRHFLLSHMDDMRYLSCQIYCSFFQGFVQRPMFVHGEGLCVTGRAEEIVTWNYRVFASEDLVFGQKAADKGLRWGFFHEYIELTSPWTWGAYLKQRRRWLWGNIHAVVNRDVMSAWPAFLIGTRYILGFLTFGAATTSVVLILTNSIEVPPAAYAFFWTSFGAWIGAFVISGWVNSGNAKDRATHGLKYFLNRVFQALAAGILCPVTAVWTITALTISLFRGNPKRFDVIAKTAPGS